VEQPLVEPPWEGQPLAEHLLEDLQLVEHLQVEHYCVALPLEDQPLEEH